MFKKFALAAPLFLMLTTISFAKSNPADDNSPVTQKKFNRMVEIMKSMAQRQKDLEAQLQKQNTATQPAKEEEAVNLDALEQAGPTKSAAKEKAQAQLKVYFDLNFYSMPGGNAQGSGLTFDNFHSLILLDFLPTEDISFTTDIETTPKFYELDYKISKNLSFRLGKIWIPFDDMNPHNMYGGRTNVSKITVGDSFLPDIFTDLGVAVQAKLVDSANLNLVGHAYIVNGFQSGGTDPVTASSLYPNFSTLPTGADNNRNKSFGARAHGLFYNVFGLGSSYYTGRWSNEGDQNRKLTMLGFDSQIYLGATSFRAGLATMKVQLPSTATKSIFSRGGSYVELGQKFGDQFNFLLRGGALNLDNRILDKNDKQIVGAKLLWKPNLIEWSIEHSRDMKKTPDKTNHSFTNLRMVASF